MPSRSVKLLVSVCTVWYGRSSCGLLGLCCGIVLHKAPACCLTRIATQSSSFKVASDRAPVKAKDSSSDGPPKGILTLLRFSYMHSIA